MRTATLALWLAAVSSVAVAGYLTPDDIKRINANLPHYRYAERLTGVPWMVECAIHYREGNLKQRPGCIGGAFGMDMGSKRFEAGIDREEQRIISKYNYPKRTTVQTDFRLACLCAGDEFMRKIRGRLYDRRGRLDEEVLADALWGYNGRAIWHTRPGPFTGKPHWKYSPYVNNHPKSGRVYMLRYVGRMHGKDVVVVKPDRRPGALIIYREIKSLVEKGVIKW